MVTTTATSILTATCLGMAALFSRKTENSKPSRPELQKQPAEPAVNLNHAPGLYAIFETTMGRIVCKLFPDQASLAVQNFAELAQGKKQWYDGTERAWMQRPYYQGLTFHRVIPHFMIQGGDYMGNGTGGVGYTFQDEFSPDLIFDRPGCLAMANAGPNTNGAQFFITVEPAPWLNHKHSIFGEVVEGKDVAEAISKTPRDVRDRPLKPVILKRVVIVDTRPAVLAAV